MGEALFCASLFLLGVTMLAALVASHFIYPDPAKYTAGFGFWVMVLVLASFVIMGGAGLIWTVLRLGISAERRSALTRQATSIDLFHAAISQPEKYPTLPSHEGLTNSPGIDLAYRLPPLESPGWRLLAKTAFALVWNGLGSVLLVKAITGWMNGSNDWFLNIFLLPFTAVSLWSIYYTAQQIWIHAGMGPTMLEISDHPLLPGREYQLVVNQTGHLNVDSLGVWLICEEEATYHQGTDVRREIRVVYEKQLCEKLQFKVDPGFPFQQACSLPIPAEAMHSFQSAHNVVRWKLVVRGAIQHWPHFERGFPLVVYPGEATLRVQVEPSAAKAASRPLANNPATGPGVVA